MKTCYRMDYEKNNRVCSTWTIVRAFRFVSWTRKQFQSSEPVLSSGSFWIRLFDAIRITEGERERRGRDQLQVHHYTWKRYNEVQLLVLSTPNTGREEQAGHFWVTDLVMQEVKLNYFQYTFQNNPLLPLHPLLSQKWKNGHSTVSPDLRTHLTIYTR